MKTEKNKENDLILTTKKEITKSLKSFPWFRGVSLATDTTGKIKVMVSNDDDEVHKKVPTSWNGIPIVMEIVGEIMAL